MVSPLCISQRYLILNAHALFRWKRNKASGPEIGKQHGRREMFVITLVVSDCIVPNDLIGDQVRESLRKWVTSPDPSTNHSIACGIQHDGSAQWFFRGGIFSEWKSTGSLLWIYGKRMFFSVYPRLSAEIIHLPSRLREEHPLVSRHSICHSSMINLCFRVALQSFETSKCYAKLV